MLGGIIGGFTYDYTHVTTSTGQYLQRSFRQRRSESREMKRDSSTRELTVTSPVNDLTITSNDCPV